MTGWVVPGVNRTPCLKRGRLWANCPDDRMTVPEKVLMGQEEDDWESDAEDDEATVMVSAILKQDRETAMFLSGEIILDDQMSQCIFQYDNLLHGILERDSYTMCEIDGGQSGLQVERT